MRKTAQALNIFTDARKRFENDLSSELGSFAMLELSSLIMEMCPDAVFEDIVDVYPIKQPIGKVSFSAERISKILGLNVSPREIEEILKKYNFSFKEENGNFKMAAPFFRVDLENEEDMAEEVGRIIGYDKIKPIIPKINFIPRQNEIYTKTSLARNKLLSEGYSEIMTYTFTDKGEVGVLESASDKKFLRTNLSDGLKESAKLNQPNAPFLEIDKTKIFEIGTVFTKKGEEIHVAYGDNKKITEVSLNDFYKESLSGTFAQVLGSPTYSSLISTKLGAQPPDSSQKYPDKLSSQQPAVTLFKMWSLYPFISRDVAVWVSEGESSEKLEKLLKENCTELLIKEPFMFDSFSKNGKTSYAFRLIFQSYDRTLTDDEVNNIIKKITVKINENNSWEIR